MMTFVKTADEANRRIAEAWDLYRPEFVF